jgi:hypothetical protein
LEARDQVLRVREAAVAAREKEVERVAKAQRVHHVELLAQETELRRKIAAVERRVQRFQAMAAAADPRNAAAAHHAAADPDTDPPPAPAPFSAAAVPIPVQSPARLQVQHPRLVSAPDPASAVDYDPSMTQPDPEPSWQQTMGAPWPVATPHVQAQQAAAHVPPAMARGIPAHALRHVLAGHGAGPVQGAAAAAPAAPAAYTAQQQQEYMSQQAHQALRAQQAAALLNQTQQSPMMLAERQREMLVQQMRQNLYKNLIMQQPAGLPMPMIEPLADSLRQEEEQAQQQQGGGTSAAPWKAALSSFFWLFYSSFLFCSMTKLHRMVSPAHTENGFDFPYHFPQYAPFVYRLLTDFDTCSISLILARLMWPEALTASTVSSLLRRGGIEGRGGPGKAREGEQSAAALESIFRTKVVFNNTSKGFFEVV